MNSIKNPYYRRKARYRYLLLAVPVLILMSLWHPALGATADGPDFFAVTGVSSNDVLNIRRDPSPHARKIGSIPHNGQKIKNLGCQGGMSFAEWEKATPSERENSTKKRWCKIQYRGLIGWVAGWYLKEDDN